MLKTDKRYLRGSTQQCPKCGSRRVFFAADLKVEGYGPGVANCLNCKALWEGFDPEQIWDTTDPLCSFREPCNNCAFRPGSPEQAKPEFWRDLMDRLKCGGEFYCHKGVPISSEASSGFAYPTKRHSADLGEGRRVVTRIEDRSKMRLCRGFLKALPALRLAYLKGVKNGTLDVLSICGDVGDEHATEEGTPNV